MPSPIGHSLIGLSLVLGWLPASKIREQVVPVCGVLFLAVMADVDLIAGALMGDLNGLHRQATHSLPVAVGASVLTWCVVSTVMRRADLRYLGLFLLAACSHLLADWLGDDGAAPYGIMLFWPFSEGYYISPVAVFPQLSKSSLADMLGRHNLRPMAQETGLIMLLVMAAWLFRRRRLA